MMKATIVLIALFGLLMVEARVIPGQSSYVYMQHPYTPQRALMFSGYYGVPENPNVGYQPEAAMSTFTAGRAVSTGTAYGVPPPCPHCQEVAQQQENGPEQHGWDNVDYQQPGGNRPVEIEEPAPTAGAVPTETGTEIYHKEPELVPPHPKPTKAPRKDKKQKKPVVLPDEEEEEEETPWRQGGGGGHYQFFPMNFGKGFGGPGTATAIANSFSSGKGGSATSTATAYGAPPPQQRGQWKRRANRY